MGRVTQKPGRIGSNVRVAFKLSNYDVKGHVLNGHSLQPKP